MYLNFPSPRLPSPPVSLPYPSDLYWSGYLSSKQLEGSSGFLNHRTTAILSWVILCRGGCPMHWKMFITIPSTYPLEASRVSPSQL